MTAVQIKTLSPILRGVAMTVGHALEQGYEPAYRGGAQVLDLAQLQSIRLQSVRYGNYELVDQQNQTYRSVVGTIEVVERDMPVDGAFEPFAGANVAIDAAVQDQGVVADIALGTTRQAPTITSISPNSGTKAGGTTVTITGTGFVVGQPVSVSIGGAWCVDAEVLSTTQVRAVTPAHDAFPTYMADVVVTNFDQQATRLAAGYSYTTP
jgi:hypothetical protein